MKLLILNFFDILLHQYKNKYVILSLLKEYLSLYDICSIIEHTHIKLLNSQNFNERVLITSIVVILRIVLVFKNFNRNLISIRKKFFSVHNRQLSY